MAKGGARARSGPPPDPDALRRERDLGEWTLLPSEGRNGLLPEWPLLDPTGRETDLWTELWAKPQAVMWERDGQQIEVALYVRRLVQVERPDSPTAAGTLLRQQAEALGLTTPGLHRNRWRIIRDQVAEKRTEQQPDAGPAAPRSSSASLRARLTVVAHGDAAV
jgi:hypothetical protein